MARPLMDLDLMSWNAQVSRPAREVAAGLDALLGKRPDAFCLQEVAYYGPLLRRAGRTHGYRVIQSTSSIAEHRSTAWMVRDGVELRRYGFLRLRRTWRGPRGRRKPGRVLPVVVPKIGGEWTRLVGCHGPTARWSDRNAPAWHEFVGTLLESAEPDRIQWAAIGDMNCRWRDTSHGSIHNVAKRVGAELYPVPGSPIDYMTARGLVVTNARQLGHYLSDHHAIGYNLRSAA